ncbi:MAG: hypothetical protein JSV34_07030, partial [Candidatus Omnitrophota bacterium]
SAVIVGLFTLKQEKGSKLVSLDTTANYDVDNVGLVRVEVAGDLGENKDVQDAFYRVTGGSANDKVLKIIILAVVGQNTPDKAPLTDNVPAVVTVKDISKGYKYDNEKNVYYILINPEDINIKAKASAEQIEQPFSDTIYIKFPCGRSPPTHENSSNTSLVNTDISPAVVSFSIRSLLNILSNTIKNSNKLDLPKSGVDLDLYVEAMAKVIESLQFSHSVALPILKAFVIDSNADIEGDILPSVPLSSGSLPVDARSIVPVSGRTQPSLDELLDNRCGVDSPRKLSYGGLEENTDRPSRLWTIVSGYHGPPPWWFALAELSRPTFEKFCRIFTELCLFSFGLHPDWLELSFPALINNLEAAPLSQIPVNNNIDNNSRPVISDNGIPTTTSPSDTRFGDGSGVNNKRQKTTIQYRNNSGPRGARDASPILTPCGSGVCIYNTEISGGDVFTTSPNIP